MGWSFDPYGVQHQVDIVSLETLLCLKTLDPARSDSISWNLGKNEGFTVSSLTSSVMASRATRVGVDNIAAAAWKKLAPPKVEFMVWLALLDKLHTKSIIFLKDLLPIDQINCEFCNSGPETADHLFVTCREIWAVWCAVARAWGLYLVIPNSLRGLFEIWVEVKLGSKFMRKVWVTAFFAIVWSTWKARNDKIFNLQPFEQEQLISCIKFRVGCWITTWQDNFMYCLADVVRCFDNLRILGP